jgi:hypothetical protein
MECHEIVHILRLRQLISPLEAIQLQAKRPGAIGPREKESKTMGNSHSRSLGPNSLKALRAGVQRRVRNSQSGILAFFDTWILD